MIQLHFTLTLEDIQNLINAEVKMIWRAYGERKRWILREYSLSKKS